MKPPRTQQTGNHARGILPVSFFNRSLLTPEAVARTSRVLGLGFVLVGTLASFYHFPFFLFANSDQTAAVSSSTADSSVDETPDGSFANTDGGTITGTTQITYTVPNAQEVEFEVRQIATGEIISIGGASKGLNGQWRRNWPTLAVEDGEYRLIAVVINEYGSYEDQAETLVLVDNVPDPTPTVTLSGIVNDSTPSTGTLKLAATDTLALAWQAENATQGCEATQGDFTTGGDDVGTVEVSVPPAGDTAEFTVTCSSTSGTADSTLTVTTHNAGTNSTGEMSDTTTTSDSGTADDSTASPNETPAGTFAYSEGSPFSGTVQIKLTVPSAVTVNFSARNTDTDSTSTLGAASEGINGSWRRNWPTLDVTDGSYRIIATVENEFGTYDITSDVVQVQNETNTVNANDDTSTETDSIESGSVDSTTDQTIDTTNVALEDDTQLNDNTEDRSTRDDSSTTTVDDTGDETITVTSTTSEQEVAQVTTPAATIDTLSPQPVEGVVPLKVTVPGAQFIELYIQQRFATTDRFIGLANRVSETVWSERWDTTNVPNGDYTLFAKVRNSFGLYETDSISVTVYNEPPAPTAVQEETIRELERTEEAVAESAGTVSRTEVIDPLLKDQIQSAQTETSAQATNTERTDDSGGEESFSDTALMQQQARVMSDFEDELDDALQTFRLAVRDGDSDDIEAAQATIDQIKTRISDSVLSDANSDALRAEIDTQLRSRITQRLEDIRRREELIRNRIGEAVTKDSDADGITDYDEVNLYQTDPFSADTDADGIPDQVEIQRGFDPTDPAPEAVVAFESPKDSEAVRPDQLQVNSITTISPDDETDPKLANRPVTAIIRGTALPNSFVTLYIFSDPIVVTVKADAAGSWTYTFDKELSDGTHEVYAGITDNAGKIVARSNPLEFVKTAQAFTPVDAANAQSVTAADSNNLFSQNIMLWVNAISVVLAGMTLIVLGMYVDPRQLEKPTSVTA